MDKKKNEIYAIDKNSTKLVTESVLYYILTHLDTIIAENGVFEHIIANSETVADLQAQNITVDGKIKAHDAEFDDAKIHNLTVDETLKAHKGEFDDIKTHNLTVDETLNANVENVKELYGDYGKFKDLYTDNLEADRAKVNTIEGNLASFKKTYTEDLDADRARIGTLETDYEKVGVLDGDIANIKAIMAGNVGTGSLQTIVLNSDNATLANGMIKSAMIENLSFDKITGFEVNTKKVNIHSDDGLSTWKDNTIMIKDSKNTMRVQIGKDAQGDYSLYIWDKDGKVMFDPLGLTKNGINRQIIDNDAIADDAMISGSKIDIDSLIKSVNANTGKETLSSSSIHVDNKTGTLTEVMNTMSTGISDNMSEIKSTNAKVASVNATAQNALNVANATQQQSVKDFKTMYAIGDSSETAPSTGWSTTTPQWVNGKFMWQKVIKTLGSGATASSEAVCITGTQGSKGDKGADGKSVTVKSNDVLYQVSSSGTDIPSGTWSKTIPATSGGQYLWTKVVITYSDGTVVPSFSVSAHGVQGIQGLRGLQGEKGDQGIQGVKGNDGYSPTVSISKSGSASTISITDKSGTHTTTVLDGAKGTPGAKGADGRTSYFHVKYSNDGGKTFTANNGEAIGDYIGTRTDFTEDDSNTVTDYTWARIKGEQGAQGLRGLQGEKGDQGIPGQNGTNGTNGKTSYFHVKYSLVANPTSSFQLTETPSTYIGTYVDFTEADSTDPTRYTWTQFKGSQGAKGDQGIAGKNGADGRTSYLHIAYANSADGSSGFDISNGEGKLYIGQYTDFTEADSTDRTKYTWSKIKGEKGDQGIQGPKGATGVSFKTFTTNYIYNQSEIGAYSASDYSGTWVVNESTSELRVGDTVQLRCTNSSKSGYCFIIAKVTAIPGDKLITCVSSGLIDKGDMGATGAQGPQGPKGDQGIQGVKGNDGKTTYFHIKYSSVANPSSSSQMTETPDTYIGTYTDFTANDSSDPKAYTWTQFKGSQGAKGDQGIAGKNGIDGKTYYLHIAYANSSDGSSEFSTNDSKGKLYLGQCTDLNQADPTTPASYQWSLIKGDKGLGVKAVVPQYYLSTSNASQSGGSWTETQPAWTSNKYIWTRSKVTWDDNSVTYSDPILANSINLANDKANQAYNLANTANSNASNALNKANSAVNQANMGMDKWLVTEYDATNSSVIPSTMPLLLLSKLSPMSTIEAPNLWNFSDWHYEAYKSASGYCIVNKPKHAFYLVTYLKYSKDTSVPNFCAYLDDKATVYLNGEQIIHTDTYGKTSPINVIFKSGWNVLELVIYNNLEGANNGGFFFNTYDSTNKTYSALDLTKLANFERMDCYCSAFSGQTAYGLTVNAQAIETSSSLETVSRTVTDNKNGVKDLMTRTSQVETNVTDLKNLENTHYSTMTTQYNNQQKTIDGTVTRLGNVENRVTTVSNDLSNLSIGGRNILLGSKDGKGWFYDKIAINNATDSFMPNMGVFSVTASASGYRDIAYNNIYVDSDTDYTLSFYAKASSDNVNGYSFLYNIGDNGKYVDGNTPHKLTTKWQKFIVKWHTGKFSVGTRKVNCIIIRNRGNTEGITCYAVAPKLEKGNKATDWSPAPEDFDNKITEQSTALATYKQTTDQNLAQISSTYQRKDGMSNYATNSSVTTAINQAKDQINSSVSSNYVKTKDFSDKSKALETRMSSAEQKITDSAIVSTVKSSHDWSELQKNASKLDWQIRTDALDLNNMTTDGRYLLKGGLTNAYSGCSGWQYLIVESVPNQSRVTQTMWHDDGVDNTGYTRKLDSSGSWTPWVREANTANAISVINQSSESIKIQANRIDIDGLVTFNGSNNSIANKIADAKKAGTDAQSQASTAQNTANTAVTNASNAQSTANTAVANAKTAQDTANDAQSRATTLENWRTNNVDVKLNHAYNVVNHWAQNASSDTTTINGGLIQTNTITADKIAIGDFTNIFQMNEDNCNNYDFHYDNSGEGIYHLSSIRRDHIMGAQVTCKAGEVIHVKAYIYSSCHSNESTPYWYPIGIGICCIDSTGKAIGWRAVYAYPTDTSRYESIEGTVTVPSNTHAVQAWMQIHDDNHPLSAGYTGSDVWVSNCEIRKMNAGELIVDGAITTNKLASKSVNASILADDSVDGRILADNAISNSNFKDENYGTSSSWINLKSGKMNLGGKLTWDGSNLGINGNGSFSGNISATSGKIASFTIRGNYLESSDEEVGMSAGDTSFWAGFNGNDGSYKFKVTKDGYMYASNANISGTITGSIIKSSNSYWDDGNGHLLGRMIYLDNVTYANGGDDNNSNVSRGIGLFGAYGATADIGVLCNDRNITDSNNWYTGLHLDLVSTTLRQPASQNCKVMLYNGNVKIKSNTGASIIVYDANNAEKINTIGMNGRVLIKDYITFTHPNDKSRHSLSSIQHINNYLEIIVDSTAYGVSAWVSDKTLKRNISNTRINGSSILRNIEFKQFDWIDTGKHENIGVIAQDVEKIDENLVLKIKQCDGTYSYQINPNEFATITAKALQEQMTRIDNIENNASNITCKLENVKNELLLENQKLKARLDYLEAKVKYMNGEKSSYSE